MYPYFVYNMREGEMIYNHDGTKENEIFIALDKKVKNAPLFDRIRLIDLLYETYSNNSIECTDIVNNIIDNCIREEKYKHIQIIAEYMQTIINTFNYI